MAIRKVARLGHPVLRRKAEPIEPRRVHSREVQRLIDDLIETMREYDGAGLAAPQVHESVRIVVYEVAGNRRYPDAPEVPLRVLVNPVLTPIGERMDEDWEGCLSLPDLRGKVPRWVKIRVDALDREGNPQSFIAKDFHARVAQHECDHLDGVVYVDRMKNLSTLSFVTEFLRHAGVDEDIAD